MGDLLDQVHAQSQTQPTSGGDLLDQVHAQTSAFQQPQGSAFHRLVSGYWDTTLGGLKNLSVGMIDLARQVVPGGPAIVDPNSPGGKLIEGVVRGHIDQAQKAKKALDEGNYVEAFGHTLATALPVIGPAAAHAGERIGGTPPVMDRYGNIVQQGQAPDVAGGIGEGLGLESSVLLPEYLKANVKAAPPMVGAPKVPSTLNPVEQAAVDFLRENNVPLKAGTITGNRFLKSAEAVVGNSPLGASAAGDFARGTEAGLQRVSGELANEAAPAPASAESAGRAAARALKGQVEDLGLERDAAYKDAWQGRDDPQFTYKLPVREESVDVLDSEGKPTGATQSKPVLANVNMPVDIRNIKDQAAPIREEMSWSMSKADQAQSAALNVLDKLLGSDDYIPAWQAEHGLSALKTMSRTSSAVGMRNAGQGTAAALIPELQDGINAAVANTGESAIRGLQAGRATHATMEEIADLADDLRAEPVQAFQQLTWKHDTGIDFLRKIGDQAPEVMPQVGRAFLDKLFDQATREGGFAQARTILNQWESLGPETKKLLYPNPALRSSLDRFFKGAEMVAQNPNPSGTALVQQATSLNPLRWLAGWAGSKLLFSPKGVALLTESLKNPPTNPAAANFLQAQARSIAPPDAEGGGPGTPAAPGGDTPAPGGPGASGAGVTPPPPGSGPTAGAVARRGGNPPGWRGSGAPGQGEGGTVDTNGTATNPRGSGEGASVPRSPAAIEAENPAASATVVRVPGSDRTYQASYKVVELGDLKASHSGRTFAENPAYELRNDRDYRSVENQRKVVEWSTPAQFDPHYHITDNPDATNGPPVIDTAGNVLGGNGRTMILDRVYGSNPKGAQAYRDLLTKKASQYGLDSAAIAKMKQPVLVREIPDTEGFGNSAKQTAITDFNVKPTAELKPSERALSDARRVTQGTLDDMASRLEARGPDATLADILEGRSGAEVVQNLIDDGVISKQEQTAMVHNDVLTPDARARVARLMLGRFFEDPAMLDRTPAAIRDKLVRMAAPLAKAEADSSWNLTPHLQQALRLLEDAAAHGSKNVDEYIQQGGLFGDQQYSPHARVLARQLRAVTPTALTKAARQYAQDARFAGEGSSLFGAPPTPAEAFEAAFGR